MPGAVALGSNELASYPCDIDGQIPTSGIYRLVGNISIRTFTCPSGHQYTDQNDGG
ncbi:hypothetical protein [Streptomyces xanthochromogenes]|uniref:hypothetical protein n=1 Tax=Streptomyces xanthochromogenes TaxID=67384 RepID=UPI001675CDC0|nr:hypothetical protein [Streptomyces xanthochromogenes]